jgi:non-specific serine/threonine protein kinase
LIDAESDAHLWAEKYSGTLADVFDIQEKVSRSIVAALKVKLSPEEEKKIIERLIQNPRAYELYLRAREELSTYSEESYERALAYLEKAIKITGENVLIYALFGQVYLQFYNMGIRVEKKYLDLASSYARKILELDPDSSRAYSLLGPIRYKEGSVQDAVKELKKALALDPNDPDALGWIVYMYGDAGQTEVAYPLSAKHRKLEPLLPLSQWGYGWLRTMDGAFEMAEAIFRQMYKMDKRNPLSQFSYAVALAYLYKNDEAYSIFDQMIQDDPESFYASLASFYSFALKSDMERVRSSVSDELKATGETDEYYSLRLAEGFALIDDRQEAIKWLENSVNRGLINYPFLNEYDPFLENIRGEPRFKKLMERVKHEWENFEV